MDLLQGDMSSPAVKQRVLSPLLSPSSRKRRRCSYSLDEFTARNHSLRIAVSHVAALAGYNPYKDLPQLLLNLVYQDCHALVQHDADLLGLQLTSEEDLIKHMALKAGPEAYRALQESLLVQKGTRHVESIQVADKLKQTLMHHAVQSKKLSVTELDYLKKSVRNVVDMGYGTHQETAALDLYERQCGCEIYNRNAQVKEWPFRAVQVDAGRGLVDTVQPICAARDRQYKSRLDRLSTQDSFGSQPQLDATVKVDGVKGAGDGTGPAEAIILDDDNDEEEEEDHDKVVNQSYCSFKKAGSAFETMAASQLTKDSSTEYNEAAVDASTAKEEAPFFVLLGSVDGIRDEIVPVGSDKQQPEVSCEEESKQDKALRSERNNSDNSDIYKGDLPFDEFGTDDDITMQPIVVECKHRMKSLRSTIPMYEQIQAVAYCLMYNVSHAEILQVLRTSTVDQASENKSVNDRSRANEPVNKESTEHGVQQAVSIPLSVADPKLPLKDGATVLQSTLSQPHDVKAAEGSVPTSVIAAPQMDRDKSKVLTQSAPATPKSTKHDKPPARTTVKLSVSRVSLHDDPIMQHSVHWEHTILPRLRSWVDAVYRIRSNEHLRYRLLTSVATSITEGGPEESNDAWELLLSECPWLADCDIAYNRRR
jgi:hypothetical protein